MIWKWLGNFKPIPSGKKSTASILDKFKMLYDNMSVFNAVCVCVYMYVHLEININMEKRHYQNEKETST